MCVLFILYNLSFNIWFNEWWADGNYWLIANTVYLWLACLHSVLLVFEVPFYLRVLKIVRIGGTLTALTYNFYYIVLSLEWAKMLFLDDVRKMQPGDILLNLALGYNLVMHFPAVVISMTIFAKEVSMYFFEFLHGGMGIFGQDPKYAMRPRDIVTSWYELVDSLDILFWIDLFAGTHYRDTVEGGVIHAVDPFTYLDAWTGYNWEGMLEFGWLRGMA